MFRIWVARGYCIWNIMGDFVWGGFVQGNFVQGDFVLGEILSRGIWSGGFCSGGFVQGDFVLEPYRNAKMIKIEGIVRFYVLISQKLVAVPHFSDLFWKKNYVRRPKVVYQLYVLSGGISSLDSEHGTNAKMMKIGRKFNF